MKYHAKYRGPRLRRTLRRPRSAGQRGVRKFVRVVSLTVDDLLRDTTDEMLAHLHVLGHTMAFRLDMSAFNLHPQVAK